MRNLIMAMVIVLTGMQTAHADDDFFPPGLTAAIKVDHQHTDLAYSTGDYRSDTDRYAFIVTQPVSQTADFGIEGAYVVTSVDSPGLASLSQADGQSVGLSFSWHPRLGNYLSLELQTGYRWNDVSFSSPAGQPEVVWYESYAEAGPVLYLYRWRVSAGVRWLHIDGRESDPGTPSVSQDFGAARSSGSYIGFTYYMDRTGSIGLYAYGGGQRGAQLVFKREF